MALPIPTRGARKNATSGARGDPDWTPFAEAGLVHGTGPEVPRRELLEFLVDQGCTLDGEAKYARLAAIKGDWIPRTCSGGNQNIQPA